MPQPCSRPKISCSFSAVDSSNGLPQKLFSTLQDSISTTRCVPKAAAVCSTRLRVLGRGKATSSVPSWPAGSLSESSTSNSTWEFVCATTVPLPVGPFKSPTRKTAPMPARRTLSMCMARRPCNTTLSVPTWKSDSSKMMRFKQTPCTACADGMRTAIDGGVFEFRCLSAPATSSKPREASALQTLESLFLPHKFIQLSFVPVDEFNAPASSPKLDQHAFLATRLLNGFPIHGLHLVPEVNEDQLGR